MKYRLWMISTISLIIFGSLLSLVIGPSASIMDVHAVNPAAVALEANFTGDPTSGLAPLQVKFSDVSIGNPIGWAWYFGDEPFDEPWAPMTGAPWTPRDGHTSVALPDGSIVMMGGRVQATSKWFNDVWRSTDQGLTWSLITDAAPWTARSGHTSVVLSDGSIILMGGYYWDGSRIYLNDVWRSTDQGTTWTQRTSAAPWTAREDHTSVVLPNGNIIMMGGYYWDGSGIYLNDVWRSTDQGATWTQTSAEAEWNGRNGHSSVVLPNGNIIMMGGYYVDGNTPWRNDIWRSTDQGASWTQITPDAEWKARHRHSSVVLPDSSIVIIGGYGSMIDDVWRSNDQGETWTEMSAAVEWTVRANHTSVVLPDGRIVLMGGSRSQVPHNDVWHSTDQGATWLQITTAAGWSKRAYHTSVGLPDGSIVLMGGSGESFARFNDVWRSTDQGTTWTQMTADAPWGARTSHTSIALPDGSIVLMAGYESKTGYLDEYRNDVWRSTDQGATWSVMNDAASWSARVSHTSVALPDGSIVLMGGWDGSSCRNDVWRSTDMGSSWTQMTAAAPWTARSGHTSVVLPDNSIILMGGSEYRDRRFHALNDVWRSTDGGATWSLMTAAAPWTARSRHTSEVLPDGSIVLMGGGFSGEVWRSTDLGATWTEMDQQLWIRRSGHTSVVLPDGNIVLMAGLFNLPQPYGTLTYELNDVWLLETAGSTEKHPLHIYNQPGIYSVALQVYNAAGFSSLIREAYINVTDPTPPDPAEYNFFLPLLVR